MIAYEFKFFINKNYTKQELVLIFFVNNKNFDRNFYGLLKLIYVKIKQQKNWMGLYGFVK